MDKWIEIGIEIGMKIGMKIAAVIEMVLVENSLSTDAWVGCIAAEREDAVDSTHAMMILAMIIVAAAIQQ